MIEGGIMLIVIALVTLSIAMTARHLSYGRRAQISLIASVVSFTGTLLIVLGRTN